MTHESGGAEAYRPAWHAVAPAGHWMNDPNGLWRDADGLWHLWFQYRDDPPAYSRTHWGRLVSRDGLAWRCAGIDFAADADSDVYSGCVVAVDAHLLRAYLTRHSHGRGSAAGMLQPTVRQTVEIWQRDGRDSHDSGQAAWQATPPASRVDPGLRDFRDPFVFRYASGWRMLVAEPCPWDAAVPGPARSCLQVWRSVDGLQWERAGSIGPWDPARVMWEVPQLLPLSALQTPASAAAPQDGDLWVLLVSVLDRRAGCDGTPGHGGSIGCSVRWHLGTFDGASFQPLAEGASLALHAPSPLPAAAPADAVPCTLSGRLLDHGPDFYAACLQTTDPTTPTEPAVVAWMSSWAYARRLPLPGFAGGPMTLPRRLTWVGDASGNGNGNGNGLRQQPIEALEQAHCSASLVTPMQALGSAPCTVARSLMSLDLEISLHMAPGSQVWLRLADPGLLRTDGSTAVGSLALHLDAAARRITLHRGPFASPESSPKSSTHPSADFSIAPSPPPNPPPNPQALGFAGVWPAMWTLQTHGEVAVRLLLDGCCAEIYVDAGAVVFSALVFLPAAAVCTLHAGPSGHVQLLAAHAWPVKV